MIDPHEDRREAASSLQEVLLSRRSAPFFALSLFALTSMFLSLTVCAGTSPGTAPEAGTSSTKALPGSRASVRLRIDVEPGNARSPWDLVFYLDGRPLVALPVPPGNRETGLLCSVPEGAHRLRVLRERHGARPDGSSIHAAEASNAFLDLHPTPEAGSTIGASYRVLDDATDPPEASLELRRNGSVEAPKTVESPRWEALCEELEVGRRHPDARTFSRDHVLPRCVRWRQLWRTETAFPTRKEVREELVRMESGKPGRDCRSAS